MLKITFVALLAALASASQSSQAPSEPVPAASSTGMKTTNDWTQILPADLAPRATGMHPAQDARNAQPRRADSRVAPVVVAKQNTVAPKQQQKRRESEDFGASFRRAMAMKTAQKKADKAQVEERVEDKQAASSAPPAPKVVIAAAPAADLHRKIAAATAALAASANVAETRESIVEEFRLLQEAQKAIENRLRQLAGAIRPEKIVPPPAADAPRVRGSGPSTQPIADAARSNASYQFK